MIGNMISRVWRLWHVLLYPTSHPVFLRTRRLKTGINIGQSRKALQQLLKVLFWLGVIYSLLVDIRLLFVILMLPVLAVLSVLFIPLLLPPGIVLYGAYLAVKVSQMIAREKERNTYDLMCLTPAGALSFNWRTASGVLYHNDLFYWMSLLMRLTVIGAGVLIAVVGGIFLIFEHSSEMLFSYLRVLIHTAVGLGIFYTGFVQSIVLSAIIGIFIPQFDLSSRDVLLVTLIACLVLQIGSYLGAALVIVIVHPVLAGQSILLDLLLPLLYFCLILALRHGLIEWLWRSLTRRLNVSEEDLQWA